MSQNSKTAKIVLRRCYRVLNSRVALTRLVIQHFGIGIHSRIRGVGRDWCSTFFRLATSVFAVLLANLTMS